MTGPANSSSTRPANRPRIAVVTALAGDRDDLQDPEVRFDSADYIAFVDSPEKHRSDVWDVRQLPTGWSLDEKYADRRHAKLPKILPDLVLPNHDFSVWVDANIELTTDPLELCRRFLRDDKEIAVFPHRERTCPHAELLMVRIAKLDVRRNLDLIKREYRTRNVGRNAGLYELPFIVRRHGGRSIRFGLCWWELICRISSRDQLSFPIAMAMTGIGIETITPGHVLRNPHMRKRDHKDQIDRTTTFATKVRNRLHRILYPSLHRVRHPSTESEDE